MKSNFIKLVLILVLAFGILLSFSNKLGVNAECVPAECPCDPGFQCQAKCCKRPPNNGGCTPNNCNGCCKNGECKDCNEDPPPPVCNTTAPSNISVTRTSATSATVSWTPGANGVSQRLYVGANKTEVDSNCPDLSSPSCVVQQETLTPTTSSYATGNVLSPGTIYYVRIVNFKDVACSSNSSTSTYLSSCLVSTSVLTTQVGETPSPVLTMSINSAPVSDPVRANFVSNNPSVASISPVNDNTYPYQTTVTGNQVGSTTIDINVYFVGPVLACTTQSTVNVINPDPWWQVIDADVSAQGNLTSNIPSGEYFNQVGAGGFPGIPAYSGTTDLDTSTVSSLGWLAQSSSASSKVFNFDFFNNQIPDSIIPTDIPTSSVDGSFFESGGALSSGYYWYRYDGAGGLDLTITGSANLGDRRIILLVDNADLALQGNINLTDGVGFFGAFVNGSINVDPIVTSLEGVYSADSAFTTGAGNTQLTIRGVLSAYGGVSLQRDLGDSTNLTTPSEVFEYAPDQIILFPSKIGYRKINWKEVAP